MSGINPVSFKAMRPEKQRKLMGLNRDRRYHEMESHPTTTFSATHGAYGKPMPKIGENNGDRTNTKLPRR